MWGVLNRIERGKGVLCGGFCGIVNSEVLLYTSKYIPKPLGNARFQQDENRANY